jgi:NADH-quinone oxidoreductase subunit G
VRDEQVVQVKGRQNQAVNKEWLCDEGRYGFMRFLPSERLTSPVIDGKAVSWEVALKEAKRAFAEDTLVFLDPALLLEEYTWAKVLLSKSMPKHKAVLAYRERSLTPVESILVSPDYAANFRGAEFSGVVAGNLQAQYEEALQTVRSGSAKSVLLIGQGAVMAKDVDAAFLAGLGRATFSVGMLTDAKSPLVSALKVVLPGRSILEKSGLLVNRKSRLQYADRVIDAPVGTEPEWRLIGRLAGEFGFKPMGSQVPATDRDATLAFLSAEARLAGLKIMNIKQGGIDLTQFSPGAGSAVGSGVQGVGASASGGAVA